MWAFLTAGANERAARREVVWAGRVICVCTLDKPTDRGGWGVACADAAAGLGRGVTPSRCARSESRPCGY